MGKGCAFCPEQANTGEHLWSGWAGKLIGEKDRYVIKRQMAGTARQWKTIGLNEKAPVLCDDCNNTWGSDIETKMKSVVADMVANGAAIELNKSDIAIIVTYSLMKAFVCDYMQDEVESFYSLRDRYAFRADLTFPRGVQIWLARTFVGHGVFKGGYTKLPLKTPDRFQLYVFTVSLGQLVIQVASSRWTKKSSRKYKKPPEFSFPPDSFSTTIWPVCTIPAYWPPLEQLRGHDLNAFIERFRTITRIG
jgi:hypothetical protein